MANVLKSRKFWAAMVGLAAVFVGNRAGVSPDQLTAAIVVIVSYIGGTALEDGMRARAGY
jgi:uncharacterized ion transporter superfamily protein YfcC